MNTLSEYHQGAELSDHYLVEETERRSSAEKKDELLELAHDARREAQATIDRLSALDCRQENSAQPEQDSSAKVEDVLDDVLTDTLEARNILEAAYRSAETAVQDAQKIKLTCEKEVRDTEDLLAKQRIALSGAEELLKQAEASKRAVYKYACLKEESNSDRAKRLNDGTMVTVICITYNHEDYIAQALDSFLMQKTNFKFKVFVGEDCGPDGTADIVRDYAARYPDIIIPFIREQNMGAQRNLIDLCQRATSPYIAFCEGDDYWIDEYKLQKQFDYMEANKNIGVCFAKARIEATEDWFLRKYYKKSSELVYPDCEPGYKLPKRALNMWDFIWFFPAHTSTVFYRWNYDLNIPDWYYRGIMGDLPIFLMQLGNGKAGYLEDIVSVYRRSNVGIFMSGSMDEHFLKTRLDHLRWMEGMLEYYHQNGFKKYPKVSIENRIKLELKNYWSVALKSDDNSLIQSPLFQYPKSVRIALNAYLSFYNDQRAATATWGWAGYQLAMRNRYYRNLLKPLIKLFVKIEQAKTKWKKPIGKIKGKLKNLYAFILYWSNTLVPKNKNLWVFSGFNKNSYMDNTMYLYEYVIQNHPEIRAVWVTLDRNIFNRLTAEGKPVVMMRTKQCRNMVSKAAVAVTDHFRMSDYDAFSGLNDRLRIVQLWHGVGLKTIGDLKNTDVPGVQFSDDILPSNTDNGWQKLIKKFKYFRHAYYRELFERYFMLVCPGQERIEQIAKPWHIPVEHCFITGHPRNILLHTTQAGSDPYEILYAPTYRWDAKKETELVNRIADSAEEIQKFMEMHNASLTIRLHPHTWRNYSKILEPLEEQYDRIRLDREKDIYQTLGKYSVMISDYSSIAYDFVLLNRPVVFFNYDYKEFIEKECNLNYDYGQYSPGAKTSSWEETLEAVGEYLAHPEKDSDWRCWVRDQFYDMSVNDEYNSERIVQEIQRRLKEER